MRNSGDKVMGSRTLSCLRQVAMLVLVLGKDKKQRGLVMVRVL